MFIFTSAQTHQRVWWDTLYYLNITITKTWQLPALLVIGWKAKRGRTIIWSYISCLSNGEALFHDSNWTVNTFSRCKSFTLPGPDLNTETNGKLVTGCETVKHWMNRGEGRKSLLKLIFWKPKNSGAKFESYRQSLWMSQIIKLSENCLSGSQKCISIIGKQ